MRNKQNLKMLLGTKGKNNNQKMVVNERGREKKKEIDRGTVL